jgi:hypothetical protein
MGLVSKQPDDEESLEQITITGFGPLDDDVPEAVEIDLTGWGSEARALLDERFHLLEAPHAWTEDGQRLFVPEDAALWIQRILEQVQDERTIAMDPAAEQIGYDLAGWDAQNLGLLLARLDDERIAHAIEEGELVVLEADEARVDAVIDDILEPDAGPALDRAHADDEDDEDEGDVLVPDAVLEPDALGSEARSGILGDLFVAADQLVRDAEDADAIAVIRDGATEAATHAPPYGIEPAWWRDLADRLDAFGRLVEAPMPLEQREHAVRQTAVDLRDLLRPLV